MEKISQLIRGIFLAICLIGIIVAVISNPWLSAFFNFPIWIIPAIAFFGVVFISYTYIKLSFRINKLEFEFTSIVNHAFRTPLTRIMWISKELEKDLPTPEKLLHLQNLENAGTRILGIIDTIVGIRNINDKSGYNFQATSLREIVEKSITKYREKINQKNITMQVSTFKDIPMLTVDLKKISFVIDVLIENAIFYTPKDGKILIDCIIKSNKLLIYVSDTGIGLSFKEKMRIFSRFYRSKKAKLMNTDGIGLGLYLSKVIVARHGGEMYAKSKGPDKGTTFFVKLPLSK